MDTYDHKMCSTTINHLLKDFRLQLNSITECFQPSSFIDVKHFPALKIYTRKTEQAGLFCIYSVKQGNSFNGISCLCFQDFMFYEGKMQMITPKVCHWTGILYSGGWFSTQMAYLTPQCLVNSRWTGPYIAHFFVQLSTQTTFYYKLYLSIHTTFLYHYFIPFNTFCHTYTMMDASETIRGSASCPRTL